MMMSGYGMHIVGLLLNVALMLGLWASSVVVVIATLRAMSGSRPEPGPEHDAEEHARERDLIRSGH
jgi:hypothetical protein